MIFAPNLSMLWADLPLPDRFERAARAGFGAVELWWPGAAAAESLPALTSRWNLRDLRRVPGPHQPCPDRRCAGPARAGHR